MADQQNVPISWSLPAAPLTTEHDPEECIYRDFFNLNNSPFSITPDPEFLFLSETHRSVLEKIQYGIQSRMGFMLLTGEVGTGKTTLCRALLDTLHECARTVYVINPSLNGLELLAGILDDLGISYQEQATKKELIDRLNGYLLENKSKNTVVIIVDDAQTMPLETLEDLRLLSNLETDKAKLLQMILVGQPELLTALDQPPMRQLKQRVAVNCHLDYLGIDEVGGYIERRLFIAGNQGQIRFAPKVIRQVHAQSGGVPRMINKICGMALIAAYAANSFVVQPQHLEAAAGEIIELQGTRGLFRRFKLKGGWRTVGTAAALLGAMAFGFMVKTYWVHGPSSILASIRGINSKATFTAGPSDGVPQQSAGMVASSEHKPSLPNPIANKAYILQVGSFNTLATTLRAVDIYSRKGLAVHWNEVQLGEKGLWYRVYAGRFATIDSARNFKETHGLEEAQIIFAPWTVLIEKAGSEDQVAMVRKHVQSRAVDAYAESDGGSRFQLFTGAFITEERAQLLARKIQRYAGVATQVGNFHPGFVSVDPTPVADTGDKSS
ncbi:MAG: AAA family ATPase [Desulfosarcinaceae bacterium]